MPDTSSEIYSAEAETRKFTKNNLELDTPTMEQAMPTKNDLALEQHLGYSILAITSLAVGVGSRNYSTPGTHATFTH